MDFKYFVAKEEGFVLSFQGLHLGWRTIKSSIAVFICISLSFFIFKDNPVLSCLASIFALREDVKTSIYYGFGRIASIVLASFITILFIIIFPIDSASDYVLLIVVPLAVLAYIPLAVYFNLRHGIIVGAATLFIIFFSIPGENQVIYAITRVAETVVGVLVAIIVNKFFPNHYQKEYAN